MREDEEKERSKGRQGGRAAGERLVWQLCCSAAGFGRSREIERGREGRDRSGWWCATAREGVSGSGWERKEPVVAAAAPAYDDIISPDVSLVQDYNSRSLESKRIFSQKSVFEIFGGGTLGESFAQSLGSLCSYEEEE
ncbi:hypothetical protein HAX54_046711 [Datura stramonium]|uniref:Uncharacterized protein n=1 Tax=Datura stramonium TaxID=4076 RepID=A0ABS8WJJ2_DATST|nr:hypothetical protein [Datura stramonium]